MPPVTRTHLRWRASRAFTLLETLVATSVLMVALVLVVTVVQHFSAGGRTARTQRELRQEALAAFSQISADLEGMPLRRDLDYRFTPGADTAFVTEQTAPAGLALRPAGGPARGYSLVAYRVGSGADGAWAGLQRGLGGFSLNDYFLGMQPPADVDWKEEQGAQDLTQLGKVQPAPATWAPQSLNAWPLPEGNFATVSPDVVQVAFVFQLAADWQDARTSTAYRAGSFLAHAPVEERPAGSGNWVFAADRVGAVIIGLALLPEAVRMRLTAAELEGVSSALAYPGQAATIPAELPLAYWSAGGASGVPEEIRRELRFEQQLVRLGSGY